MASSFAARRPLGRPSLRAILWDLEACITEPAKIIYYCTRDIVRRLIFNGERGTEKASLRGTGKGTVSDAVKATGTPEEEPPAVDEDELDDDDDSSAIDWDAEGESIPDEYTHDIDYAEHTRDVALVDNLRSQIICYDGDNPMILDAYRASKYLVELLAVSPCSNFEGRFYASDVHGSLYYCSSERGETRRNLDAQGNLILHSHGGAFEDYFYIKIKNLDDEAVGFFSFTIDEDVCNHVIRQTMTIEGGRKIKFTFIPMHTAIEVDVKVTLDLISASASSAGGSIYYVGGEISAHHKFYDKERVVLFSRTEEDRAEVTDGKLPLSRTWAAVPVSLEPLLIIKLNLRVGINHDDESHTIPFRGDLTFYRGEYEKIICSADNGEVKVQLWHR